MSGTLRASDRDKVIAGLEAERAEVLREQDRLTSRGRDDSARNQLIERLIVIKAALVGLGAEDGPMPAYNLAMAYSRN